MSKRFKSGGVLLLLYLLINSNIAYAEPWRVVTEILPPLQVNEGELLTGTAVTKVTTLLQQSGITASIEVFPWARAYEIAKSRPNTLIFSMARYENREPSFHWIGSMGEIRFSFVALADREEIQIHSKQDAKKWILGTVRNDFIHDWLLREGFTEDEHFVIRSDLSELADLLYKGLIDGLLVNKEVIKIIAEQQGYDPERLRAWFQPKELSTPLYLAANIDSEQAKVEQLRQAFLRLAE